MSNPFGVALDLVTELTELAGSMARHALTNHGARLCIGFGVHFATRCTSRHIVQIRRGLRDPLFRHELLGIEINRRRSDALAILRWRDDAFGEGRSRLTATSRAAMRRRAMFGHFDQTRGRVKDLPNFDADGGTGAEPRDLGCPPAVLCDFPGTMAVAWSSTILYEISS